MFATLTFALMLVALWAALEHTHRHTVDQWRSAAGWFCDADHRRQADELRDRA